MLINIEKNNLYPIVVLEQIIPHGRRHILSRRIGDTALIFAASALLLFVLMREELASALVYIPASAPIRLAGISLVLSSVWAVLFLLEAYFRSHYFHNGGGVNLSTLHVFAILNRGKSEDLTSAFSRSFAGGMIMRRCGISAKDTESFLSKKRKSESASTANIQTDGLSATLADLAASLMDKDAAFSQFLFQYGITRSDFIGAAEWVARDIEREVHIEKWWSKERLGRVRPLGRSWVYGSTYVLDLYSRDVSPSMFGSSAYIKTLAQIEDVLSRSREANVLIIGEGGGGKDDIVRMFAGRIATETASESFRHKRVLSFDTDALIASTGDKISFEREVLRVFDEAARAGDIILVFADLPSFILSAKSLDSDVMSVIDPYLETADIQVIAMSDPDNFHRVIRTNHFIAKRFENVTVLEPPDRALLWVLEDEARILERQFGVFFTYSAVIETLNGARNYFSDAVLPEKAIDLLVELAPRARRGGGRVVRREHVFELLKSKTNIPLGEVGAAEKEVLMNLEEVLHGRIVGQEEAVAMVASAMRRARAGVRDVKRPIGSFLFIGPTGVGKTETAKALAEVFFGNEDAVLRIDMSEYQTADAVSRLAGSLDGDGVGTLSKMLREKPYGVLLLDEFEKTNPNVHDLFLQILDEGFFSDVNGKRVNARNVIFIATSNVGSELIWEAIRGGKNISAMKDKLVGDIIARGKFKPELLNRFDGVVLFHPLETEHLRKIASLLLGGLKKRLMDRGIALVVNDMLIDYVAREGYDPAFGARPMKRVIQENIEQAVAEKLISGELREGATFEFKTP